MTAWVRVDEGADLGYERGNVRILDNGGGMGSAKGSGRWAVMVDGKWVANVDTLAEAKAHQVAPAISAQSVARALTRAGYRTSADRSREGVRVTGSTLGSVSVIADYDGARFAARRSVELAEVLVGLGYTVDRTSDTRLVVRAA